LVSSGVGPFYDGVAHFFVTPEDIMVVIALALFGGLSGRAAARALVMTLPIAWLVGTALGRHLEGGSVPSFLPAIGILTSGLLVALDPKVPTPLPAWLAAVLGLLHGFLNGRAMVMSDTSSLAAVGIAAALATVSLLLAAVVVSLRLPWQKIVARVIGSWAAAIGLLALAWKLKPDSP
jgi:hydrogenase/urease accessory protein HupE